MIKPLTSLRFVFAFMVFLHHLNFLSSSSNTRIQWVFQHIFEEGFIGVSFFFILSGFILAYNYQHRILGGTESISRFITARIARIYPLHVLTLIAAIPLIYGAGLCCIDSNQLVAQNFLANLFLVHSFFPEVGRCCYFNGPSWSISVEFFFYILFPVLIYTTQNLVESTYKLIVCITTMFVVILGFMLFSDGNFSGGLFYRNPLVRTADFLLGICLYNLFRLNKTRFPINYSTLWEIGCIALFILFFTLKGYIPLIGRYSIYYWLPVSIMIYVFAFQSGRVSKILSNPILILLGEISFAFYMIHQIVLRYMDWYWERWAITEIERVFYAFVITLVLSYVSYKVFELPMNKWLKKNGRLNSLTQKMSAIIYGRLSNRQSD